MEKETYYFSASGPNADNCFYIGLIYDAKYGYKPQEGEAWIISHQEQANGETIMRLHYGTTDWLTRLWRSEDDAVYATSATNSRILYHPNPLDDLEKPFETTKVEFMLDGIWGLNSTCIFAWGDTWEGSKHLLRFDGKKWMEISAPKFAVRAMHGIAENLIYAVGVDGGIARWNGKSWKYFSSPTGEILNSVTVVDKDLIFCTGGKGSLVFGNGKKFFIAAEYHLPGVPLLGVGWWNNEVWIAAGRHGGLYTYRGKGTLVSENKTIKAVGFDTRNDLLIACENQIAGLKNDNFIWMGEDYLLNQRKDKTM